MPERIREYELLEPLGKGGMGQIYRGRHVLLDSFCAVKVIRRELLTDAELRARFLREALILRRLNASPFIVNCETVFEENEQLYLVMELLEGETLGARMKRLPPSWQRDRRIFLQTVEAVAFAHQLGQGILHRDIKPSNIFILKDDAVKVLDFGLAKQLALEMEDVTATGQMIGTPAYMPPEVLKGDVNIRDVGPEGDVYALGVLAYRLFTGKLPYDLREDLSSLDALTRLTKAHLLGAALTPLVHLCPDLPSGLSAAVMAALEPDAARRPKDASELLKRLQQSLQTQASPVSWQGEDENNDQTLVINLPKFGEVGSKAQRGTEEAKKQALENSTSGKSPASPIGRFIAYNNGTILDTKTNLMWAAKDNGKNINWRNAKSYCENYSGGGHADWRMPTLDELAELYESGVCSEKIKIIYWVWGSENRGPDAANFGFSYGIRYWTRQSYDGSYRALPVRSAK